MRIEDMTPTVGPVLRAALALGMTAVSLASCEEGVITPASSLSDQAASGRLATLDHDLARGHQGPDVQAVQAYLARYGYLPNDALARAYPAWRPLVKERPPAGVYEQHTEAAVRLLQQNNNLAQTGRVDAATRQVLRQLRCGVPDGIAPLDRRDKFALISGEPWWGKMEISWRFNPHFLDAIPADVVRAQLEQAFNTWATATSLQFTQNDGPADIEVSFAFLSSPASTTAPPAGDIQFDWAQSWSTGTTTPTTALDLQSAALHEIGHALGLAHSSGGTIDNLVMFPGLQGGKQRRFLSSDDDLAIQFKGTPWVKLPGCARDIGMKSYSSVWAIDCYLPGTSGRVMKWNDSTSQWVLDNGNMTGTNIAVDASGFPWIQAGAGTVLRKTSSSPTSGVWKEVGGCWHDIGISRSTNDVWVTACHPSSDGLIWKFNRALGRFEKDTSGGIGRRISVDSDGRPWAVHANGEIYRRTTSDVATGWWEPMPGGARDVAVSGRGTALQAWVIGIFDEQIYMWNEQMATGDGSEGGAGAPRRFDWVRKDGFAHRIAVGPGGPWVVTSFGEIFREAKYW